jgi:autotransporter adhesin
VISKFDINFAPVGTRWVSGVLASFLLTAVSSHTALAAEAIKGPAPTAADNARFTAVFESLVRNMEGLGNFPNPQTSLPLFSLPSGFADTLLETFKAGLNDPGNDTLITRREAAEASVFAMDALAKTLKTSTPVLFDGAKKVGEAVQASQAAVKYDDVNNKAQLTLNPGGQSARLTNVQSGALTATSTDAVNGSQLSSTNARVDHLGTLLGEAATGIASDIEQAKAYTDTNIVTVSQSVKAVEGVATQAAHKATQVAADVASLQKGTGGAFQVNARSSQPQPQASGNDAVAGGSGAQAVGQNSLAVGTRARAEGSNSSAVGSDAKALADNSVAVGAQSVAERKDSVSVGRAGAERQITHVAAGSRGTDAVNVSQLAHTATAAVERSNAYTDRRFTQLHHELKEQDNTLSAGIAGAMAMANLPRSIVAGSSMTSVGVGNYRGESALAVGVSYVSDSGRWSSNFMGTANTRSDMGVALGVGYQW